ANESGFTARRVPELLELVEDAVSLETPIGEGGSHYGDVIEDTNADAPHAAIVARQSFSDLSRAFQHLEPRLRRVLNLRFGLDGSPPQTLEQVSASMHISRERVRQIESQALRRL